MPCFALSITPSGGPMRRIRIILICILALCVSTGALAQKKTAIAHASEWQTVSPHIWKKVVTWNSGIKETVTLTDDGTSLLFEARSVCAHDSRIVAYTWSHKDHHAMGISCAQVPRNISTRTWSEVIHPLPQGVWATWVYHNGLLSKR